MQMNTCLSSLEFEASSNGLDTLWLQRTLGKAME